MDIVMVILILVLVFGGAAVALIAKIDILEDEVDDLYRRLADAEPLLNIIRMEQSMPLPELDNRQSYEFWKRIKKEKGKAVLTLQDPLPIDEPYTISGGDFPRCPPRIYRDGKLESPAEDKS